MAAHKQPQQQKDYFDISSPASSSPSSTPGGTAQEWGPPSSRNPQLSGRYQPRRGSTASSVVSASGWHDKDMHGRLSALRDVSQNAISALLQPPIVRTGLLPHTSAPASSTHRPPSTRDIPPVTLTNIPHVEPSVFKPYLAQVGSLYEARARTAEAEEPPPSHLGRKDSSNKETDDFARSLDQRLHTHSEQQATTRPGHVSRQGSSVRAPLSPLESPQASRRRGSGSRRRLEVTPLSTIPQVYFDENFHLENPRTFDVVSERSEVVRTPITSGEDGKPANGSANGSAQPPRKALATNAILQEKLSWYLDTVEIHLISSISAASKSFFAALGSLKELHSEAADSVTKIKKLREDLAQLDRDMAVGGLEIVGMKQRRENLRKLNDSMDQLRNVVNGAAHCDELVDEGDLELALDHIAILEEYTCGRLKQRAEDTAWLTTNPQLQIRDLRRLKALSSFAEGMDQLRARVGKGYENRFLDALLTDLRQHISSVPNQDTTKRWAQASLRARGHASGPSVVPAYLQTNSQLRQTLSVVLHGLSRSKSLTIASAAFRDAIMREIKGLIRQHLPSSSEDDAESVTSVATATSRSRMSQREDKSARLARAIKALGPDDAEEMFMKIYCGVGEALRRLQTQIKMLLDVTSAQVLSPTTTGPRSPPRTPNMANIDALSPPQIKNRPRSDSTPLQEELMQALDMSSLLGQAVDVAQTQITKILKVRAEHSTVLSLTHFLRYFTLNRLFADECEAVSGRSGASLKNVVNTHITEFISNMSRNEREQIERTMDNDTWTAKDVQPADEVVLAQILEGMSNDPQPWVAHSFVWEDNAAPRLNGTASHQEASGNGTSTPKGKEDFKPALIDEEKFILPASALAVLHGITRYQTLVACIPSIAPDISKEVVEYLRFFNSRMQQLVLGAGATRSSAALPNINTKHLALASRACSFILALVPYMREFMRRRPGMSAPEKLSEYDKVRHAVTEHSISINEKLLDIMSGRCGRHVKAFGTINFDDEGDAGGVSSYMQTMCKEMSVMQRTLGKYLPEGHVRGVVAPIFVHLREGWGAGFRGIKITTQHGKERLLREAEYFEQKLGKIDGAGDTGAYLVNIVKEKNVAAAPPPAPVSKPAQAPATAKSPSPPPAAAPSEVAPELPSRLPSSADVAKKEDAAKAEEVEKE